jgi:hypothetical protein
MPQRQVSEQAPEALLEESRNTPETNQMKYVYNLDDRSSENVHRSPIIF